MSARKWAVCALAGCLALGLAGCTKEELLDQYDRFLRAVGQFGLTSNAQLKGSRDFASDTLTGSYHADYAGFSGKETVFGGAYLDRDGGDDKRTLSVSGSLQTQSGAVRLEAIIGSESPATIAETAGDFSQTLSLPSGSSYVRVIAENFTGVLDLRIE